MHDPWELAKNNAGTDLAPGRRPPGEGPRQLADRCKSALSQSQPGIGVKMVQGLWLLMHLRKLKKWNLERCSRLMVPSSEYAFAFAIFFA